MGLFSDTETVIVSSVVYNMAGEPEGRPDFLKTVVVSNAIVSPRTSTADALNKAYMNGPGIKLRSFFRWIKTDDNYDAIGIPKDDLLATIDLDNTVIEGQVPHASGDVVRVQKSEVDLAVYHYWADQWIMDNHPTIIDGSYTVSIDYTTNEITIVLADTTTYSFIPSDYVPGESYLYVTYDINNGPLKVYIYKVGSGNSVLDDLIFRASNAVSQYFPLIPCRINNVMIDDLGNADALDQATKAYKRLTGKKLSDLLAEIEDNPDLSKIDYAYVCFGVSVNVEEPSCRRYIWNYFDQLWDSQPGTGSDFSAWEIRYAIYKAAMEEWEEWRLAQHEPSDPNYGTPPPYVPPYPTPPTNSVKITPSGGTIASNFNMQIIWNAITKTTGAGAHPDFVSGKDVWWTELEPIEREEIFIVNDTRGGKKVTRNMTNIQLNRQFKDHWETLTIVEMAHRNYIYDNQFVQTNLVKAITEDEVEQSGFLVPLHYPTFKSMSLTDSTQMATACVFMVFNCYEIYVERWYQSGIFSILVVIAVVVITVATGGAGASTVGLLGQNAVVGAALGLTGLAATIVGAIANAFAAIIVTSFIQQGAAVIFGEKIGALIGAVVAFVALNVGQSFSTSTSINWNSMMDASNILQLTNAVGSGISGYMAASAKETMLATIELQNLYNEKIDEISELFRKNLGITDQFFDPLNFVSTYQLEPSDVFLSRTLLTGSDIADISMNMLSNFPEYTLDLNL